jgi:hypothetical protein
VSAFVRIREYADGSVRDMARSSFLSARLA